MVVTIVVLLILAGITINFFIGDNGIFKTAQNAKEGWGKAQSIEKIKLVISNYFIKKQTENISEDYFWDELENQGIIGDKETDRQGPEIDDDGNKKYEVETTDDYTVEIIIDKNGNIKIGEVIKSGVAKISNITISTTVNSLHVEVETKNMEKDDQLVILYRPEGEGDYTPINSNNETTADKTGLTVGKRYEVQVQIIGKDGTVKAKKTKTVQAGIAVTSIELNTTEENLIAGDELQLTVTNILPEDATNKEVDWLGNNVAVASVNENGKVTTKASGEVTITAIAKDGSGVQAQCHITVSQPVTGVSINPPSGEIEVGKTLQLSAIITPSDAEVKDVTWSVTNGATFASVSETGLVTGNAVGEATITVTTVDGNKTASCTVTVKPKVAEAIPTPNAGEESEWGLISQIANAIKNDTSIPNYTTNKTIEVDVGEKRYKISMTDKFYVKYNGNLKEVRIIGFKHDDLSDGTGKAGITFEFVEFLTGTTYKKMNSTYTNKDGWYATAMRSFLNGTDGNNDGIKKLSSTLQTKIKQVKKPYATDSGTDSLSVTPTNDYLWLLSCTEIWGSSAASGYKSGYCKTTEGRQYLYYSGAKYNNYSDGKTIKKPSNTSSAHKWWLRSPYSNSMQFCDVKDDGSGYHDSAHSEFGVAPGFCI